MATEVDSVPLISHPLRQQHAATILCCNCGAPINGTSSEVFNALCYDCIKLTVDITEGIQREATLHICRDCDRWLSPPNHWLVAALESRELLALCLRKLRGLSKSRIIDASFIWTEPHSRRIKVKITVQQEAAQGTILQQTFEVEYVVAYHQCPDCAKSYTHNTWRANVQVRQKVPHKRTFLQLEQHILKHGAHKDAINIKEVHDGIDFFFAQRNQAEKFLDFLTSVAPVRSKKSSQLISTDIHTSTSSYKFTFSVELVPICKDDLVALPLKLAKQIGNMSPIALCYRIGTNVNLLDPNTLQTADIPTPIFWRTPFSSLADVRQLTEFIVMDIEPQALTKGRFVLAEATVRRVSDLATNDTEYATRTHLGGVLHPGDSVMGYHLSGTNYNSPELEAIEESKNYSSTIPDVLLVKKVYPRRKKSKSRNWRLKRMAREERETLPRKQDQNKEEMEYEMFLRDVEEDADLRSGLALYKAQQKDKAATEEMQGIQTECMEGVEEDAKEAEENEEEDDDHCLEVPLDQLQDEFDGLSIAYG